MLNKPLLEATATEFCCFASFNVKRHLDTKSITLNLLKPSSCVKNSGSLFGASLKFLFKTMIRNIKSKP